MRIINDILDISRIESGMLEISNYNFDLHNTLKEIYVLYSEKIYNSEKRDIALNLNGSLNKKFEICADEVRLKQILGNLIDNAIKFTESGSIEFGYIKEAEGTLLFYVKDTGIGIPEDKCELIFERFRQVEEQDTKQFGGTGLGLAICKNLTQLMGGQIWVESNVGKGTNFYFTIRYEKGIDEINEIDNGTVESIKECNVLIVEDDLYSLEYLKEILDEEKFEVTIAENGEKALDLLVKKRKHFDVVLMDIQLPDINGIEITREIKKRELDIPVIAQTAFAMESDRERCIEAGCCDYLKKPIVKEELLNSIKMFVNR